MYESLTDCDTELEYQLHPCSDSDYETNLCVWSEQCSGQGQEENKSGCPVVSCPVSVLIITVLTFHLSRYKKTSETLSTAGQKTSAAFTTLGTAISRKFGDMRYNVT